MPRKCAKTTRALINTAVLVPGMFAWGLASSLKAQHTNEADSLILVEFYRATNGDNWTNKDGWLQAPVSEWEGVGLDDNGRVLRLDKRAHGLTGIVPSSLGNLTRIEVLNLSRNRMGGSIPQELGKLAELKELLLINSDLIGPIPSELGQLTKLEGLALYGNRLTGPIPPELGQLTNLQYLYLLINELSGPIPSELGNLQELVRLYLHGNQLSGLIPSALQNLRNLERLDLGHNLLTGTIPPELGQLNTLENLDLAGNQLTGTIPAELGQLSNLLELDLGENQLSGAIPPELGRLAKLDRLWLEENQLSGQFPPELGQLTNLKWLLLKSNRLDDMPNLAGLARIEVVDMSRNRLSFEDLEANVFLVSATNEFRYAPQDSVGIIVQRTPNEVIFTVNSGGAENNFQWYRDGQAISGANAAELRIDRRTPDAEYYATVTHPLFRSLTLTNRPATPGRAGELTASVADSLALVEFYRAMDGANWHDNTGWLQAPVIDWKGIGLSEDGSVSIISLPTNGLTGSIPPILGRLANLVSLELDGNALAGLIPPELGDMPKLRRLLLGGNELTGPIPEEFGNLPDIERLKVEHNQLDGLPDLTAVTSLNVLDVSSNRFVFEDLLPNESLVSSIDSFVYAPQNPIETFLQHAQTEAVLTPRGTASIENQYQWFRDGQAISNAFSAELRIDYSAPPGALYYVEVTQHRFPELTLRSRPTTAGAVGTVFANEADSLALVEIYNSTDGGNWDDRRGWLDARVVDWVGVGLNSDGRVFIVSLPENGLRGPIPSALIRLTDLERLILTDNELSGRIPSELDQLVELRTIRVGRNQLEGSIPLEIQGLTMLVELELASNALSGPIPEALGQLTGLVGLDLNSNQLTGPIPDQLGALTGLWWLRLASNNLSGPIPEELGQLREVTALDLAGNRLNGPIPAELSNLSQLKELSLSANELTGSIPTDLDRLVNLEVLALRSNLLQGSIPPELGTLTRLHTLDLSSNELAGTIPPEMGRLGRLVSLHLAENQLSDSLPPELGNLARLRTLTVDSNQLSGPIPPGLADLTRLERLSVQNNLLDGMPNMTEMIRLDTLDVSNNRMSFEDLEPNSSLVSRITAFRYTPQDSIETLLRRTPSEVIFTLSSGGSENLYRWFRNNLLIAQETAAELRVDVSAPTAFYHAMVTHPQFPGLTLTSRPLASDAVSTSEDLLAPSAMELGLYPNYPNPFAGLTRITFDVEEPVHVRILVYDMLGRQVQTLLDAPTLPGRHRVTFDATGLAAGLYYCRMQAGSHSEVQAMTVIR